MSTAVVQTFQILQLLADKPRGMSVSEIAATLGVNKQIPFRHLALLEQEGYVRKDASTERYFLTFKIGALGLRQIQSAGLDEWAQPTLDRLAEETGELVRLAAFTDGSLSWIGESEPANFALRIDAARGNQAPLTSTASGRAILSMLPSAEARRAIKMSERVPLNEHTITDPKELEARIQQARTDGYAVVVNEREYGVCAVAAAIPCHQGPNAEPFGAVSVSGPTARMTTDVVLLTGKRVAAAAAELSGLLPVYAFGRRKPSQSGARGELRSLDRMT